MDGTGRLARFFNNLIIKGFEHFGRYYSEYRGIVADNEDPENLQRVKIKVPEIYGRHVYPEWVYPRSVFSGKGYGAQVIPQQGDLITVIFEYGNPRRPRWDFGYFAKVGRDTKESEITDEELRNTKKFWFKTPKGLLILLDDSGKDQENTAISLVHPSGITFRINGETIDMELANGKFINLGKFDEAAEFAVKGETHLEHHTSLDNACASITVATAFGPSSTPLNQVEFFTNREQLSSGLSSKVKLE